VPIDIKYSVDIKYPVFVYGTLKKGYALHSVLKNATFLGKSTMEGTLINLGPFPALLRVVKASSPGVVKGELYKINSSVLAALDIVEAEGHLYNRVMVKTTGGMAWTYELREVPDNWGNSIIESGEWTNENAHKDIAI